ncbi:hypothetical protein [Humibacillus xanthopallidus]|uniref:hypothetical protein n=1 Tax=Humibacillus xanthopallidus TaxID=412689 RepID=UPI0038503D1F
MNDRDLDAEFQRIVAGWDDEAPEPVESRETHPSRMPSGEDPAPAGDAPASTEDAPTDAPKATGINPAPTPSIPSGPAAPGAAGATAAAGAAAPPVAPTDPAGPAPTDIAHGGGLGLPIASTTSHVWRASTPSDAVDDVDALLDEASAARGGEPDDHFVPPSEIDLPSAETDPMFWAIVGGLVGGPLLLLYLLFFDRDGSGWWVVTAIAMLVVGFVLLVLRGGSERDPFDDGTRV